MVGERVRFLFTSCEESQMNEQVFEQVILSYENSLVKKSRTRLLIGHTIFFTSEKNRMTNEIPSHQRETTFIW